MLSILSLITSRIVAPTLTEFTIEFSSPKQRKLLEADVDLWFQEVLLFFQKYKIS